MPRYRITAVVCEVLAHDTGHWCRRCLLGSGVRAWVTVRLGSQMHLQTRVWCDECGGQDIEVAVDHGRH